MPEVADSVLKTTIIINATDFTAGLDKAADDVQNASSRIQQSSREVSEEMGYSMGEARHAVLLLGEETGVHFPRAIASMIASVGPLGTVLAAAFPLIGIIGLVDIVDKAVEKFEEWRRKSKEVADAWDDVEITGTQAIGKINDQVLQAQIKIDELNHNQLAALHEELLLIDHTSLRELDSEFDVLAKKADDAFKKMQSGWLAWLFLGESNAGIKEAQDELDNFKRKYDELTSKQDKLGAISALASELDKVKSKLDELKAAAQHQEFDPREIESYEKLLGVLEQMKGAEDAVAAAEEKRSELAKLNTGNQISNDQATVAKQQLDTALASLEAQRQAAKLVYEQGGIDAQQWVDIQTQADTLAYQAHEQYFAKLRALYASNPQKLAQVDAEQLKFEQDALAKSTGELANETKKYNDELSAMANETQKTEQKEQDDTIKRLTHSTEEYTKALKDAAQANAQLEAAEQNASFEAQAQAIEQAADLGTISEKQKAEQLRALYQQEENELLTHLNEMRAQQQAYIQSLQAALATDPGNIALKTQLASAQAQIAQLDQQILNTQVSFGQKIQQQNVTIWKSMMQPVDQFFSSLKSGMNQAISGLVQGTQTPAQAFRRMFADLIASEIQFVANFLAQKAEMWAQAEILDLLGITTSQTQQATVQTVANFSKVQSNAAVAASEAYAAAGGIPGLGDALAAAAFADVMAYAPLTVVSASGGMDVPEIGGGALPAFLHSREMVLPEPYADVVRSLADDRGSSSAPAAVSAGGHFHYHAGNVSALDRSGVEEVLGRHPNEMSKLVKKLFKSGRLSPHEIVGGF